MKLNDPVIEVHGDTRGSSQVQFIAYDLTGDGSRPRIYSWPDRASPFAHLSNVAFNVLYAAMGFSAMLIVGVPPMARLSVIMSPENVTGRTGVALQRKN